MQMNELPPGAAAASPDVFHQLGLITRQLHDSLSQLGALLELRHSVDGLSDARSRLNYIARKTGEAADKVLTAVELAKHESAALSAQARRAAAGEAPEAPAFAEAVQNGLGRIDEQLTAIMLAQDFHDLTGQVVSKVVALAGDLEDSLVKLLVQTAPADPLRKAEPAAMQGPVIDERGRDDVARNQGEVDDLLASLGF